MEEGDNQSGCKCACVNGCGVLGGAQQKLNPTVHLVMLIL